RAQNQLIELQVQPASELEAGLPDLTAEREPELLVHLDGDRIVSIDSANHHVIVLRLRALDERLEQEAADTASAAVTLHIDGVLDGVLVGGALAEHAVRGKAEQAAGLIDRADDRVVSFEL